MLEVMDDDDPGVKGSGEMICVGGWGVKEGPWVLKVVCVIDEDGLEN